MKLLPLKSSLLALAIFAAPSIGLAAQTPVPGSFVMAQADDAATGSQRIENIRKFLAGAKNLSKLPEDRLQQRLKRATGFQRTPDLPPELASGLQQEVSDLNAELAMRKTAGAAPSDTAAAPSAGTDNSTTAPAANKSATASDATTPDEMDGADAADDGAAQDDAAGQVGGKASGDVAGFIQSVKPASELTTKELRQQMRRAMQLSKSSGIDDAQKKKLRQIARDSRQEFQKRKADGGAAKTGAEASGGEASGGSAPAGTAATNATAQNNQAGGAPTATAGEAETFLQNVKPVAELKDPELRMQMQQAAKLFKNEGISKDLRQRLRKVMREGRQEMARRKGGNANAGADSGATEDNTSAPADATVQQPTGGDQQQAQLDNTKADPASEQRALAIMNDKVDAQKLSKQDLRKRLSSMRDLLATNQLSPATKKALRERLARERAVLRNEVGQQTGNGGNQGGDNANSGDTNVNVSIDNSTTNNYNNKEVVRVVLADRRPSRELKENELRRRINIYREAARDNQWSERDRQQYKLILERDRVFLRERMLNDRRRRQQQLQAGNIDINLGLNFQPDRPPPPRSVFAAEADDSEIEDILAAPPRRKIDRRYSVEEVESNPQLRDAVSRIEIDTVHFGFGEGFLREEEIVNLDRIAEVMEKILAASPDEVFMIEGHTDAVGSDAANLELSRERSKAVKEALSTYYVIPEENLKTVGFGERYLKIPTAEPEAENRRVSIARITALVGALDE